MRTVRGTASFFPSPFLSAAQQEEAELAGKAEAASECGALRRSRKQQRAFSSLSPPRLSSHLIHSVCACVWCRGVSRLLARANFNFQRNEDLESSVVAFPAEMPSFKHAPLASATVDIHT